MLAMCNLGLGILWYTGVCGFVLLGLSEGVLDALGFYIRAQIEC